MSKKHFIALADFIKASDVEFTDEHLMVLAAFCRAMNSNFMRDRWVGYIRGENGPNGGTIKRHVTTDRCRSNGCDKCRDEDV